MHLFHYKIKNTQNCTFCDVQKEYPEHLLFECPCVKFIWRFIADICEIDFEVFTVQNVMLNNVHSNPKHVLNAVTLITKQYIYATKCIGDRLSTTVLKNKIIFVRSMEESIAKSKGRPHQHVDKWSIVSL